MLRLSRATPLLRALVKVVEQKRRHHMTYIMYVRLQQRLRMNGDRSSE